MKTTSLIGHAHHLAFFRELIGSGKFPGAVLLTGPSMVGKSTLTEQIAQMMLCLHGTACTECTSCRIALGTHPDALSFSPNEEESDREQASALIRRVYQRPLVAPNLVVFLHHVDQYSPAVHALLLKSLEDAPSFAHFFLTVEHLDRLPATIRSRALVRTLSPVDDATLMDALLQREVSSERAETVMALAFGRPGLALRLLEDTSLQEEYARSVHFFQELPKLPLSARSTMAAEYDDPGRAELLLTLLQGFLRKQLRSGDAYIRPSSQLSPLLRRSREGIAMLRANIPPRLVLEYVFFIASSHEALKDSSRV